MRRSAEAEGVEAFARALQGTFPARDDAPLALALLRLLSEGRLDDRRGAGPSSGPHGRGGRRALERLAHVERDQAGHIVAFSGLTLRPTAHEFMVGTRRLHTWCVWDTLFLPACWARPRRSAPAARSPARSLSSSSRRTGSRAPARLTCVCRFRRWRLRIPPTSPGRSAATSSFSLALTRRAAGARRAATTWASRWTRRSSLAAVR